MSASGDDPAPRRKRWRHASVAALLALLIAAWLVYRPGLSGDFLFDDFGNLPAIGATGPVDNGAALARYLSSGEADPTGRPLTLASFLIDARGWPTAPYSFKVTNVLLHLLNGALLYWVLLRLGGALRLPETQMRIAALFGAGAWLLHPLLVSTTLYVVQREAMLPATFTLLGMLGWMTARDALATGRTKRGLIGMAVAAWGCTALALLCKANGALLPLLLLLVEWIALAPRQPMPDATVRRLRIAVGVLLILPSLLLLAWMLKLVPALIHATAGIRDWTIGQRLLSEPRALADYLALLFVPRALSTGVLTDAFAASTGWLQPWTTLPCIALLIALIATAFAVRRRHPAIALALLFYFAAQLLESGWLPLELYYEHRNYLPALLLFWPIGIGLGAAGALRRLRWLAAVCILILLGALTFQRAALWGDGYRLAQTWAAFNTDSARAQANAAQYDLAHGLPRIAAARLRNAIAAHPHDLQIPVNLIGAECRMNALRPQSLQDLRRALATSKVGGTLNFNWFNEAIDMAKLRTCKGLDFAVVQSLLDSADRNPYWRQVSGRRQDLAHLQGMLDLAEGRPKPALDDFDRALKIEPRPDTALEQAAILGSHGQPRLGLAHLDYFATLPPPPNPAFGMPRIHAWVLRRQDYWQRETTHLRTTLNADAAAKPAARDAPNG